MSRINHNPYKIRARVASAGALASFIVLLTCPAAFGLDQDLEKLNRFVQTTAPSNAALTAFREGRDLIEEKKWNKAADTFTSFITKYPKDKNVDAALYWLAFALKNQQRFRDAEQSLHSLLREYPQSAWIDDARAMQVEIAGAVGDPGAAERAINEGDEEIKTIALQSLFQSSPDRALAYVADVLKPGSKLSPKFKENALHLLGRYGGKQGVAQLTEVARRDSDPRLRAVAIAWLGRNPDGSVLDILKEIALNSSNEEVTNSAIFALVRRPDPRAAAFISELARSAPSREARKTAIQALAHRGGDNMLAELTKLFDSEQDVEIKTNILHAVARRSEPAAQTKLIEVARSNGNPIIRRTAIHLLGRRAGDSGITELFKILESDPNPEMRREALASLSLLSAPSVLEKLYEVARSSNDLQMRREAISALGRRPSPQTVEFLVQVYNAEKNTEIKHELINTMGRWAQRSAPGSPPAGSELQLKALTKLIEVAKTDLELGLRREAIENIARVNMEQALDTLVNILAVEKSLEVKRDVVESLARWTQRRAPGSAPVNQAAQERALAKLLEIARTDASPELRGAAIQGIARSGGDQAFDTLASIYDGEKSDHVKVEIIGWIGRMAENPAGDSPRQKRALKRLMEIAKSDSSLDLRKEAVQWLGRSKDPEAAKFIEDILK